MGTWTVCEPVKLQGCKYGPVFSCCVPGFCFVGLRCRLLDDLTILVTMSCNAISKTGFDAELFWRALRVWLLLIDIPMVGDYAPGWGPAGPVPTCSRLQSHACFSLYTRMNMNARLLCDHEADMVTHVMLLSQHNQHHEVCVAVMHESAGSCAHLKPPAFLCVRKCNADQYTVQR